MAFSFKRAFLASATSLAVMAGGTAVAQAAPATYDAVAYEDTGSADSISSKEDLDVLSSMSSDSDGDLDAKKVQEWLAIGVTVFSIMATLMQGGGSSNIKL